MKLAYSILYTINQFNKKFNKDKLTIGKTILQKIIYFAAGEESNLRYVPYLYGPYSSDVQLSIQDLVENKYITVKSVGDYEVPGKYIKSELQNPIRDSILVKIDKVISFLKKHNLTHQKEMAYLAKIYMFMRAFQDKKEDELVDIINSRAKFNGWNELSKLENDRLNRYYIDLSKKLYKILYTSLH